MRLVMEEDYKFNFRERFPLIEQRDEWETRLSGLVRWFRSVLQAAFPVDKGPGMKLVDIPLTTVGSFITMSFASS